MKDNLPIHVVASSAIARGNHYHGSVPVAQLPRLAAALAGPGTQLAVDLRLSRDAGHAAWLRGAVSGTLTLTCQRCLNPFPWPLSVEVALRLVTSEAEEARVLGDCDPLLIDDDRLPLRQVVEDEALLAIPLAPRCEDPECVATGAIP